MVTKDANWCGPGLKYKRSKFTFAAIIIALSLGHFRPRLLWLSAQSLIESPGTRAFWYTEGGFLVVQFLFLNLCQIFEFWLHISEFGAIYLNFRTWIVKSCLFEGNLL